MTIYCLMSSGVSLSDPARDALFQTACNCIRDEKNERKVYHDDVRGIVHTDFNFSTLGHAITGIVFEGEIETDQGSSYVKFIVNTYNLEKVRYMENKWISFDDFIKNLKEKNNSHKWN